MSCPDLTNEQVNTIRNERSLRLVLDDDMWSELELMCAVHGTTKVGFIRASLEATFSDLGSRRYKKCTSAMI